MGQNIVCWMDRFPRDPHWILSKLLSGTKRVGGSQLHDYTSGMKSMGGLEHETATPFRQD